MKNFEYRVKGELTTFMSKDKIRLNGFLMKDRKTDACVIYVHGMGSNFYTYPPYALFKYFSSAGFAVFPINTRGHEPVTGLVRFKNGKKIRLVGGTNFEIFEDSWKDIAGAIEKLESMGFRKFVLCGHSTGCQKVAYYQYKIKDTRVIGLILLAPADDYNLQKRDFGKNFKKIQKLSGKMAASKKKNELVPNSGSYLSAQRLYSLMNPKSIEARLFDYEGNLKEFSSIRVPMYAAFGDKEEYAIENVAKSLKKLDKKTRSVAFTYSVIKGADHSFTGKFEVLGNELRRWLKTLV